MAKDDLKANQCIFNTAKKNQPSTLSYGKMFIVGNQSVFLKYVLGKEQIHENTHSVYNQARHSHKMRRTAREEISRSG
jgi:hypothetical protein